MSIRQLESIKEENVTRKQTSKQKPDWSNKSKPHPPPPYTHTHPDNVSSEMKHHQTSCSINFMLCKGCTLTYA